MRYLLAVCLISILFMGGAAAGELGDASAQADQISVTTPVQDSITNSDPISPVAQEFGMRRYLVGNVPRNPLVGLIGQSSKSVIGRPTTKGRFFSFQVSPSAARFVRFYPSGTKFGAGGSVKPRVTVNPEIYQPVGIPVTTPIETIVTPIPIETILTPPPTPNVDTRKDMTAFFMPSGWMGDYSDIEYEANERSNPHSSSDCIKIVYSAKGKMGYRWAGIYWQYPENNWGTVNEGRDLTGNSRLTFWARGKLGGEVAEFKVGGIEKSYRDSLYPVRTTGELTLTTEWKQYSIDLTGADLSKVMGGFCWVTNADLNPAGCTIYLDDIFYE